MRRLRALTARLLADQRVLFVLVGGVSTVIGLGFFVLAYHFVGHVVGYMGALVIAYALGLLCSFGLHRRFTFKVRGQVLLDLARFTGVNIGSLGVNALLLPFFVEIVGLPVIPAQVVTQLIVVCSTYLGHRYVSFRRPRG